MQTPPAWQNSAEYLLEEFKLCRITVGAPGPERRSIRKRFVSGSANTPNCSGASRVPQWSVISLIPQKGTRQKVTRQKSC